VPLKSIFKWHLNLSGVGATGPRSNKIQASVSLQVIGLTAFSETEILETVNQSVNEKIFKVS